MICSDRLCSSSPPTACLRAYRLFRSSFTSCRTRLQLHPHTACPPAIWLPATQVAQRNKLATQPAPFYIRSSPLAKVLPMQDVEGGRLMCTNFVRTSLSRLISYILCRTSAFPPQTAGSSAIRRHTDQAPQIESNNSISPHFSISPASHQQTCMNTHSMPSRSYIVIPASPFPPTDSQVTCQPKCTAHKLCTQNQARQSVTVSLSPPIM